MSLKFLNTSICKNKRLGFVYIDLKSWTRTSSREMILNFDSCPSTMESTSDSAKSKLAIVRRLHSYL